MSLTDDYENAILDAFLGDHHSDRFPDTVLAALFLVMPGEDGTGGEQPAGGAYAPVLLDNDTATWPDAEGSLKSNGVEIAFPTPTANWGEVIGYGLLNPDDDDAVIWFGELAVAETVLAGEAKKFVVGAFVVRAD